MKFNWVNFKGPIDFIQQFMNGAATSLADRKDLWRALRGKRFYGQKAAGTRELYEAKKANGLLQGAFLYWGWQGVYQAHDLSNAGQVIPDWLDKCTFLEHPKLQWREA